MVKLAALTAALYTLQNVLMFSTIEVGDLPLISLFVLLFVSAAVTMPPIFLEYSFVLTTVIIGTNNFLQTSEILLKLRIKAPAPTKH